MLDSTATRRQFADVRFLLVQVRANLADPASARDHLEEAIRRLDGLSRQMGFVGGSSTAPSSPEAKDPQE